MKTSSTWNLRSVVGKIIIGLVLATMIGSINVAPALGKDYDKGRYEKRGHAYGHNRPVQRSYDYYGHRDRVYYPPPRVVYAPPSPPGIGIFFPPFFFRP